MPRTLEEIHQLGMEALRERLGPVGMIRFLQQFALGHGDYAIERREWVDRTTFDDIRAYAGQKKSDRNRPRAKRKKDSL